MHTRYLGCPNSAFALGLLSLYCLTGCGEEPEITSYDRPRDADAPVAAAQGTGPQQGAAVPTRMLAAVILRDTQAWFIKATGPEEQVDEAAHKVRDFINSVELPEDQPSQIGWEVPEGWSDGGERMMREATLIVPETSPPLEVAISKLPYSGDQEDYLKLNINRWRGQLGLADAEKLDAEAGVEQLDLEGAQAWIFDATGDMAQGGGMTPPMMRGNAPFANGVPPASQSRSPRSNDDVRQPAGKPQLVFDTPDGWTEGERGSMGSRSYVVGEGDDAVTVKVSDFAAFGMMADPLMNVNRWRGQLGAAAIEQEKLDELSQRIEIAGTEGTLTEIVSPDNSQSMLAAMVVKYEQVWFFQLMGSANAVGAHRDEFVDWLAKVEITKPTGGEEAQ